MNWSFIDMLLPYRALLGTCSTATTAGNSAGWRRRPSSWNSAASSIKGDHFPAGQRGKQGRKPRPCSCTPAPTSTPIPASWRRSTSGHRKARPGDLPAHRAGIAGHLDGSDSLGIASLARRGLRRQPENKNLVLSGEYFYGRQTGPAAWRPPATRAAGTPRASTSSPHAGASACATRPSTGPIPWARWPDRASPAFGHTPRAVSGLLEYDTSEFGRFRAEYTHDMSDLRPNDELMFQYTVVYGPHGAHRY